MLASCCSSLALCVCACCSYLAVLPDYAVGAALSLALLLSHTLAKHGSLRKSTRIRAGADTFARPLARLYDILCLFRGTLFAAGGV